MLFAALIANKYPFADLSEEFMKNSPYDNVNNAMIAHVADMRGTEDIYRVVEKYGMERRLEETRLDYVWNMKDLKEMLGNRPDGLVADEDDDAEAIDLLQKMLVVDHADRITAFEALDHPYFDKVKDYLAGKTNPYKDADQ